MLFNGMYRLYIYLYISQREKKARRSQQSHLHVQGTTLLFFSDRVKD